MSSKIELNGITMNYRTEGPDDAAVVMLSNSLLTNYGMWDDQMEALLGAGFRVLRYDTRGHGGTDAPAEPYSIALFVEDVIALLDALGIPKVHFVGLSMGGFIGQLLGALHPDRVLSLNLCDTACIMPHRDPWNHRIKIAESDGVEALIEPTLERWFTAPFHKTNQATLDKVRAMIRANSVQGYVNCAITIRDLDQCHVLADISAPTQIVVGEDDPATPLASAKLLHEGIADSVLVVLKNAAHLPNIEQRKMFNQALLEFLTKF